LAQTERIVVISNGEGGDAGAGASRITKDITNIISQVPATVEALTGVNLMDALGNLRGVKQSDQKSSPETNDDGEEQA
jgi:flotillin